ncbi:Asp-tRNA(Asn)/Glu-tRNA(Gln) amidotransferase subunit GatC [soil metagenome]
MRHSAVGFLPVPEPAAPVRITPEVAAKVAQLARLDIEPDELVRMTAQLEGMLEHFADIDALDLSAVEPMTQAFPLVNVLRADVVQPCLDRDEVLAAAPAAEDGRFRVPPIIGSDL